MFVGSKIPIYTHYAGNKLFMLFTLLYYHNNVKISIDNFGNTKYFKNKNLKNLTFNIK